MSVLAHLSMLFALLAACGGDGAATEDGQTRGAAVQEVIDGEARSADGVVIRYSALGSGEPVLVLVHGWTNDRSMWGQHLSTLSRTHRVVALDLAGHGVSGADRADWTIDAFGGDVVAVANDLGLQRMVLVGFSMGAAVVLEAAERLGDRALGVVFVDMFHDPEEPMDEAVVSEAAAMFRSGWGDTTFLRAFAYTPDTPDSIIRRMSAQMPAEPREHWFAALEGMGAWITNQLRPALRAAEVPIAAINTDRQPTDVEAMRRYAPSFTLDTIAGVGHAGILHERIADFDARLLAIVRRFAAAR